MRRFPTATFPVLLLVSLLAVGVKSYPVQAGETIYIRADGSIDPPTAPIETFDNITYTFTDNIYDEIVVERNNTVVDGVGYRLQGTGSGWGLNLTGRSNITLRNIEINLFIAGIILDSSSFNTVSRNNITNTFFGFYLASSSFNNLSENNIAENDRGICLDSSSFNTVSRNNITNNNYGIHVYPLSSFNTISGNNITNNSEGIHVYHSCSNNTISQNNIANNDWGVCLWVSSFNTISGNNITNNYSEGIILRYSSNNNVISGNNITNNDVGVYLSNSSSNIICGNNITNNLDGVHLAYSSNNTVSGNNMANNFYGVYLHSSSENRLYHNNFITNSMQTYTHDSVNVWDDGCEGNYWSDYNGTDLDSDGIGDTELPWWSVDSQPLINPYWNPGDINHDLTVDIFDAVLVCDAYGSTPSDLHWNCHCDITEPYGVINLFDAVLMAMSYGEEYSP